MLQFFSRHRSKLIALALFCATALLFSRALFNGFQTYDDPDYVTGNAQVKSGLNLATVRWAFTTQTAANWHPLTWLSHALDWSLYGAQPTGHHATNVVFHAINAALVFLVLRRLTGAVWASAACAALFAFHPLRVESVAWVAERKDVLSAMFWWLSLLAYVIYAELRAKDLRSAWRWYVLSLATFVLGLLSKPMLVTLPCVLLLLDVWPLGRFARAGSSNQPTPAPISNQNQPAKGTVWASASGFLSLFAEKLPFFAFSAASCVCTYIAQQKYGVVSDDLPPIGRLANAAVSVSRYIGKFFWPSKLSVLYPHPGYWPVAAVIASAFLVLAVSILALAQWRRRPWLAVGWLWFLGTLVPVSGIIQVGLQSMADRYTYLPIVGLQIALVWSGQALIAWSARARQIVAGLIVVWLAALATVTWQQQAVWKTPFSLFDHAVRVTDKNFLAWNNIGATYSDQQHYAESIPFYRKAIEINPTYALSHSNLANALAKTGVLSEALYEYRIAIQLNPKLLLARRGYAVSLTDANRLDEALEQHRFVLEQKPNDVDALNGCGLVLELQGRHSQAEKMFLTALEHSPNEENTDTHINLGSLYAMTGRLVEAAEQFRGVLAHTPDNVQAHNNLANVLATQGKSAEAVEHYKRALELQPDKLDARCNLGVVLFQLGRLQESRTELLQVLAQRPDLAQVRAVLEQVEAKISILPAPSVSP